MINEKLKSYHNFHFRENVIQVLLANQRVSTAPFLALFIHSIPAMRALNMQNTEVDYIIERPSDEILLTNYVLPSFDIKHGLVSFLFLICIFKRGKVLIVDLVFLGLGKLFV